MALHNQTSGQGVELSPLGLTYYYQLPQSQLELVGLYFLSQTALLPLSP